MRFARTGALLGVGLLWLCVGPLVVLLALLCLGWRPVRTWLRQTRRVVAGWAGGGPGVVGLSGYCPGGRRGVGRRGPRGRRPRVLCAEPARSRGNGAPGVPRPAGPHPTGRRRAG